MNHHRPLVKTNQCRDGDRWSYWHSRIRHWVSV